MRRISSIAEHWTRASTSIWKDAPSNLSSVNTTDRSGVFRPLIKHLDHTLHLAFILIGNELICLCLSHLPLQSPQDSELALQLSRVLFHAKTYCEDSQYTHGRKRRAESTALFSGPGCPPWFSAGLDKPHGSGQRHGLLSRYR